MLETELWSYDPGKGRAIKATIQPNMDRPKLSELNLQWDDGQPVAFPLSLTVTDLRNLADLCLRAANGG
jgi:hypothetical protein